MNIRNKILSMTAAIVVMSTNAFVFAMTTEKKPEDISSVPTPAPTQRAYDSWRDRKDSHRKSPEFHGDERERGNKYGRNRRDNGSNRLPISPVQTPAQESVPTPTPHEGWTRTTADSNDVVNQVKP